jgi:hypothetical protein
MISKQLKEALEVQLVLELGPTYKPLKYMQTLEQNSFTQGNDKRYGVRAGATPENVAASVQGAITYVQSFEFVLTKGFAQDGVSDSAAYDAWYDLHQKALLFNNRVVKTKAGEPSLVANVLGFNLAPPLFLDDKVAVLTGNIDIIYRLPF